MKLAAMMDRPSGQGAEGQSRPTNTHLSPKTHKEPNPTNNFWVSLQVNPSPAETSDKPPALADTLTKGL